MRALITRTFVMVINPVINPTQKSSGFMYSPIRPSWLRRRRLRVVIVCWPARPRTCDLYLMTSEANSTGRYSGCALEYTKPYIRTRRQGTVYSPSALVYASAIGIDHVLISTTRLMFAVMLPVFLPTTGPCFRSHRPMD